MGGMLPEERSRAGGRDRAAQGCAVMKASLGLIYGVEREGGVL